MGPRELILEWVKAFNRGDADEMAAFYFDDAINHQMTQDPVEGREAIREMFRRDFETAKMTCIVESVFVDGDVAILEWRDPLGLRGSGIFHIRSGKIFSQRGYWDKLTFLKQPGLPIE